MNKTLLMVALVVEFAGGFPANGWAQTAPHRPQLPGIDRRSPVVEAGAAATTSAAPAVASIRAAVAGAAVEWDRITGAPRLIQSSGRFLTGPNGEGGAVGATAARSVAAETDLRPVKTFLAEHRAIFGHGPEALESAVKKRDFTDAHNGLRTVVWQQAVDGIPVFDALLKAHVTARGELVNIGSAWMRDPVAAADAGTPKRVALAAAPVLDPAAALAIAAVSVGETVGQAEIEAAGEADAVTRRQAFKSASLSDASAELVWLPMDATNLRLCWQTIFSSRARSEMFLALVDASTGEMLLRRGLTHYISNASYRVFPSDSPTPFSPGYPTPIATQPAGVLRTLVTTPALNTTASPNGWIDDGGNQTVGNNADAHTDTNADNSPDLPRPQGSPARVFDFALDLTQAPSSYKDAAVTQLFYWCNVMHDRLYALGFTEATGNFQTNNFGRGGLGNDAVQADAQDGSGTDNANFSTPPDGSPGRMQMYTFTGPAPDRDGDFDAEVVLHEYTHGLSNRLVGGGIGISELQPSGMGEGWSDFYALSILSEAGDNVDGNYAAGGYASYLLSASHTASYYYGIRRYPYTTDLAKNPLTFKDIDPTKAGAHPGIPLSPLFSSSNGDPSEVHSQGEVWCVTLWEMRANLVRKYGFATGNTMALQLVTDGMKLAPADPTFLQARDAILQAELVLTAGANRGELWSAFAKRGMGSNATAPVNSTTTGVLESFDVPDDLGVSPTGSITLSGTVGGPFPPTTFTLVNSGTSALAWTSTNDQSWLTVTPASGTLAVGGTVPITAAPNATANTLHSGSYTAALTFKNTTSGIAQSRTVALSVSPFLQTIFTENFESGVLAPAFWTTSGTFTWRTQVATANGPHGGTNHLTMDSSNDGTYARNEATLTLNLAGQQNVILSFWAKSFSDEADGPPAYPFTGGADFDGVAVSANGTTWYEVQGLRTLTGTWQQFTVDLDAAIAAAGIAYNSTFKIRFNQYDNFGITTDGIAIDDILVANADENRLQLTLPASLAENAAPATGTVTASPAPGTDLVVNLASSLPGQLNVPATVTIPGGQVAATFPLTPIDDTVLNGTRPASITASAASPWITAIGAVAVQDNEVGRLAVSLPASVGEGAGTAAGTVSVTPAPAADVSVALASSNPAEITVPATVTIPAGQSSAPFTATIIDDSRIDGTVTTTITASVANWTSGSAQVAVADNETTALAFVVPAAVREGDGTATGQVRIAGTLAAPLLVTLGSSDTTEITLPSSVTILAGQTAATFTLTIVDDTLADGAQTANLTATASGFATASAPVAVADNDAHHFTFDPVGSAQVRNQPFAVTITANDVNGATITNFNSTLTLTGTVAVTPAALTGWVNGVWTGNVTAAAFGSNVVLTASDGQGHTGSSNAFTVGTGAFAKFGWSTVPLVETQDTFFGVTVTAQDAGGNPVSTFSGTAALQAQIPVNMLLDVGTGTSAWDYPMHTFYHDARTQAIYLATELGGPRRITSLALNVTTLPGQTMNAWTIRMKPTALASYPSSGAQWESVGWTTVYHAAETVGQTGWVTFQLSTPFDYDGVSNLLVDFSYNNSSYTTSGSVVATTAATNRSIVYATDSGFGDPLTWSGTANPTPTLSANLPNLRLGFSTLGAGNAVAIDPPVSENFVGGVWSGQVSVPFAAASLSLLATSGPSSGASNSFTVQAPVPTTAQTTVFSETFESGTFGSWWTMTGTGTYRIQNNTALTPHGGTHQMTMDTSVYPTYSRNEATLTVNLAGRSGVALSFWGTSYSDSPDGPPTIPFTTGANFDGVAISANGTTWYEVQGLRTLTTGQWTQFTVNLDAALAIYGLSYNSTFKIRFNQYGFDNLPYNGIGIDDITISAVPAAIVVTVPAQTSEGAGVLSGTVKLPSAATSATTVTLSSSAPAKISVPASVVVSTGQTTANFALTVRDNRIIDGSRNVVIGATTAAAAGSATIAVADNDLATFTLSAPQTVTEGATGLTGTATLSTAPSVQLTFAFTSSNPSALTVPATLVFAPGVASVTFPITVPDNTTLDGTRAVSLTASAAGWPNATANISVLDNETPTLSLTLAANAREGDAPLTGTVTAGFTPTSPLTVTLSSSDGTEVSVPGSLTIPAGANSATFTATIVDDTETDGTQSATITAKATGLTTAAQVVTVADNDVHHFNLSAVASPEVRSAPFAFTVTAKDVNDVTLPTYAASPPLTAAAGGNAVAITPAVLAGWANGTWIGAVSVNEFASGVVLTVAPGTVAASASNAFDVVLGPLHHFAFTPVGTSQAKDIPFGVAITAQDLGSNTVPDFAGPARLSAAPPPTVKILSWITYADTSSTGEYVHTKQAISTYYPTYTETSTTVTDPAALATALAGKHVFLIPEQENAPTGVMGPLGAAWSSVLGNFVSSGGVIIVCSNLNDEHQVLVNSGLMTATKVTTWTSTVVNKSIDTPLTASVAPTFSAYYGTEYSGSNGVASYRSSTTANAVVLSRDVGTGHVVLIGSDFTLGGTSMDRVLANAVMWAPVQIVAGKPIAPAVTEQFVGGVWSGTVSVPFTGSSLRLVADDAAGHFGQSNSFIVSTATNPTISTIGDQTIDEDGATLPLAFTVGDGQTPTPALIVSAVSTEPALVPASGIVLGGSGKDRTIKLTPLPDEHGVAEIILKVTDGDGKTATAQFFLTVNSVNDAPSFTKGSNESTGQNAGPQRIVRWATAISAGPLDEAGQALDFIVASDQPDLFTAPPAIAPDGTLTFTPAPNTTGSATVSVTLRDNGGTAFGGADRSVTQTFVITTGFVNDPPSFVAGPDVKIAQDAGPQTLPAWATKISSGPADEAAQALDFRVSVDHPELLATPPAIAPNGTLTFAPAHDGSGTATVTVRLHDDGGTADGGGDLSAPQTFTIAVTTFAEEAGTYHGLVRAPDGVNPSADRAGLIRVAVNHVGAFSGRLILDGRSHSFQGHLDRAGNPRFGQSARTAFVFPRSGAQPLSLTFQLDVSGGTDTLTGSIHDEVSTFAVFNADRALFTAKAKPVSPLRKLPAEFPGAYTLIISARPAAAQKSALSPFPQGDGAGTARVGRGGSVRIVARLADGTVVTYANFLSKTLVLPFYDSSARGCAITGPITFRSIPAVSDLDASGLIWFRALGEGKFYPEGWPDGLLTDLVGSRYISPPRGAPVVENFPAADPDGNALLTFSDGGLAAPGLAQVLNLDQNRAAHTLAPNKMKLALRMHPETGLFSGTFVHPASGRPLRFNGAILQKQVLGGGAFRTDSGAGGVTLAPR